MECRLLPDETPCRGQVEPNFSFRLKWIVLNPPRELQSPNSRGGASHGKPTACRKVINVNCFSVVSRILRSRQIASAAACVMVSALAVGCGGGEKGPATYPVTGTVTFDGEPIENGRVLFREVEGDRRAYSAPIKNGNYELTAQPGSMTVEITASRIIPGKFDNSNGTPEPVGEMYIPAQYNRESTLTAEVKPSDNEIPFELKSE